MSSNNATAGRLLGKTPAMRELRAIIDKLSGSQAAVYISGESGTGKELVARNIHALGPCALHSFVAVNCGAIPADLMEAEFFGHRRGAFTGANRDHIGLIASADGGTLFLDEVAELPLPMQVKLLRVIQEQHVRRVGDTREQRINTRIICATHRDLGEEVANGRFREDLYYRLNVIEIAVPPLREHRDDIPLLAACFLRQLAKHLHLEQPPTLSNAAMAALLAYDFPGNIRELNNILERAVTLSDATVIEPDLLRLQLPRQHAVDDKHADGALLTVPVHDSLQAQLEAVERQRIVDALTVHHYNKTHAARALGITFRALRYRMHKLAIDA